MLKAAATKLLSAREVLYPVAIHLLDVSFLDESTMAVGWPAGFDLGVPINFIGATATLEKLAEHAPKRFAQLKAAVQNETAEVCGGSYLEREDAILPIDSQLWNLRYGLDRAKELLGADIRIFARRRFGYHPHLPLFLSSNGLAKALFLTFDETSGLPNYANIVVSWPSPDGKQVDAFARQPKYADSVETFFNLGHIWFKTTREDHAATVFLLHRDKPTAPWYRDLMELARLAPVLGQWTTFSQYLSAVTPGEYPSMTMADDFHFDYLSERIDAKSEEPVSAFARHLRTRRRIDACWTYAALHRSLAGVNDTLNIGDALRLIEKKAETTLAVPPELEAFEKQIAGALAERLQSRAAPNTAGLHDPQPVRLRQTGCHRTRRRRASAADRGIVKACQLENGKMRAVVEIPALGFAWLPREGPPGTPPMTSKMRLGDQQTKTIRNEFFEVEVDGNTGGLKAIRDHKTQVQPPRPTARLQSRQPHGRQGNQRHRERPRPCRDRLRRLHGRRARPGSRDLSPTSASLARPAAAGNAHRDHADPGRLPVTAGTPTSAHASPGATNVRRSSAASMAWATSRIIRGRKRPTISTSARTR